MPKEAAHAIRERADFSVQRIHEIEAEVRHDVIAFTTAVAEIVGPHARWFHYGLTSNDVVDTAQALLIKQASALIAQDLEQLAEVLERRAWEFKDTPMVGRTHGIHAEPITFGFKLANWYSERNATSLASKPRPKNACREIFRSGRNLRASHAGNRRKDLCAARFESGSGFVAGNPARPACPLSRHARRDRFDAR